MEKVTPGEAAIATGQVIALKTRDGSYLAPQSATLPKLEATAGPRSARHEFNVYRIGSQSGYVRSYDEIVLIASVAGGRGWVQYPFVQWGTQIALPGAEDLALIRLAGPVPADAAVPVRHGRPPVRWLRPDSAGPPAAR